MTLVEVLARRYGEMATGPYPIEVKGASRLHLPAIFAEMGFTTGAEIGVWAGEYSEWLCKGIPGLSLTCVDPWQAYHDYPDHRDRDHISSVYAHAMKRLEPYGVTVIRKMSVDAAKDVPNRLLDFVYIDANHGFEYVVADLAAWIPKIRSGGVIAGHDYKTIATRPDLKVVEAVNGWTTAHHVAPWYVLGRTKVRPDEVRDKHRSWLWEVA
jgi:hypothetical protein